MTGALVTLIDLGSLYWAAWHSSANEEVSAAHSRAVASVRRYTSDRKLVAVCCDSPKSWRKELEPQYKANRPPQDHAAYEQLRLVKETLRKDGLLLWEGVGFEADDVIATACKEAVRAGHAVEIVSADKDMAQLVGVCVTWVSPKTGMRFHAAEVRDKFGVSPDKMRDWLALVGDTSDNVAGVPGVGPKGASKLLTDFGSIVRILAAIHEGIAVGTPKITAAIDEARTTLMVGMQLVTLREDVPLTFSEIYERREQEPLREATSMDDIDEAEFEEEATDGDPFSTIGGAVQGGQEEVREVTGQPTTVPLQPANAKTEPQSQPRGIVKAEPASPPPSWDLALEPTSLGRAHQLAKGLYESRLYSRFNNPDAIWAVIIRGREMGLGALVALDNFHVIEGKPAPHAHLLIARAKSHPDCEYFQFVGGDDTYAEYECKHRDNPKPTRLRYTIEQARAAGLLSPTSSGKPSNWQKRPAEMLRKTCAVQLARIDFPDATQGLYAIEELGGEAA